MTDTGFQGEGEYLMPVFGEFRVAFIRSAELHEPGSFDIFLDNDPGPDNDGDGDMNVRKGGLAGLPVALVNLLPEAVRQ